jgi:hypothetical protein
MTANSLAKTLRDQADDRGWPAPNRAPAPVTRPKPVQTPLEGRRRARSTRMLYQLRPGLSGLEEPGARTAWPPVTRRLCGLSSPSFGPGRPPASPGCGRGRKRISAS